VPRIESVFIHRRKIPLVRPFITAVRTAYVVDATLIEVRDSDGRSGWGEAPTSWRVTGESAESVAAAVSGPLTEAILGASSLDPVAASEALERAIVGNSSARTAVDCALYDLAAAAAGVPLFRYLGGTAATVRTDMTLSASVTAEESEELIRIAVQHVDDGFSVLKIKTGAGGDDAATVAAVRRAVGQDITLRVDANQGWTPEQAVRIIEEWEDAGVNIDVVEQPVRRDDIDGLAFVTNQVATLVLADETVWTRRNLREVLNRHAADLVNIKLAKTGGLREAVELAKLAAANGVGTLVGCMSESHVGIAAAAALASSLAGQNGSDSDVPQDLDAGLWLTRSPAVGGVDYSGETIRLSSEPGTGIRGLIDDE
jgi:L-Ala-D/L-Glu epimerase